MGFELDEQSAAFLSQRICAFDLEFVGDLGESVDSCYLWNIGAIHMATGATFSCVMNPVVRPIPPAHENCVAVTDAYLTEHNAVDLKQGLQMFFRWLGTNNVLVAHNNFKADKLVLEQACRRAGVRCPLLYFMDSLLFVRNMHKHPSYKLGALYEHYVCAPFVEQHKALPDAIALSTMLTSAVESFAGAILYPTHSTPLQNIRWVGPACERKLLSCNFSSVETLKQHIWAEYCRVCVFYNIPLHACIAKIMKDVQLPVQNIIPIVDELEQLFV